MTTKTTIIHHSADADGLFCREIAKKFLPDAKVIGWDFGDPSIVIPDGRIYVLDLPVDRVFGFKYVPENVTQNGPQQPAGLIWIDHHKSSIETHPKSIAGYRIDGVAACRLAWQWFSKFPSQEDIYDTDNFLPSKQEFIDRKVSEPLAVRLAGEYDIWDKRDPRAELFQHGLRSREMTPDIWETILGNVTENSITVDALLEGGKSLQYAQTKQNESIIKELGFTFQWEGITFLACNHARYNSFLFTVGLKPEHDACFGFKFTGHCAGGKPFMQWSISLYHAPGKEHHDLSKIAVKYGGGGHRGACGFQTDKLPFLL